MSRKLTFSLAGSRSKGGKSRTGEPSMVSARPDVEDVDEDEGDVGVQAPRVCSNGKAVARRGARISLSQTSFRDEVSVESLKRHRVQGDPNKMFECGSGSTMQKTLSVPLTPGGLSPADETMVDFQEMVRGCHYEAVSSCLWSLLILCRFWTKRRTWRGGIGR